MFCNLIDCGVSVSHNSFPQPLITMIQERCENILRSNPESRLTMELHLACIESKEQKEAELLKKTAIGGAVAMGALGVAGAVASVLLTKR